MAAKLKQLFAEVFGFACFQGFLFALFGTDFDEVLLFDAFELNRGLLLVTLLFAALNLGVLRALPARAQARFLAASAMYVYAVVLIAASLALLFFNNQPVGSIPLIGAVCAGAVQGSMIAPLLCAWGRLLGSYSLDDSAFVVIAGSTIGALVSAVCCLALSPVGSFVIDLLPLGVASTLHLRLTHLQTSNAGLQQESNEERGASVKAIDLSARIMGGTFVFGVGSGFAHSFIGNSGQSYISFPVSLLIFFMLGIAALQIFFKPVSFRESGSAQNAAQNAIQNTVQSAVQSTARNQETANEFTSRQGAIAYVYRLAILMMVTGFLFAPALQSFVVNGPSIVFAGFLGLLIVLVIVFLVNAFTTARDPALAFSAGFSLLLGGQALGLLLGGLLDAFMDFAVFQTWAFAVAGLLIMVAFLFMFTENDLGELGTVAQALDSFDEACAYLAQKHALSKRESEILPLALKGRTSERIAEQFVISKSTVDTHLRRIYTKCNVHSRQELIDLGERVAERIALGRTE